MALSVALVLNCGPFHQSTINDACWVTGNDGIGFDVPRYDAARSHNCSLSNLDAWQNKCSCTHERVFPDHDARSLKRESWFAKVVRTGAQVGLLGNSSPGMNLNGPQTISVCAIAQARVIVKRQMPRNIDSSPLMDKWSTIHPSPEYTQYENPPSRKGLRRPPARQ
jgi:hypothetical protein